MHLEKAIQTKQELDSLKPFDKKLEERVMQKIRLDWNYHSNNIEGNSLTYGETKSLILHHITANGKPLRDHFEITGHNEALLWVMDIVKSNRTITENFIRELHILILKENYFKPAQTLEGKLTQKEIKVGEYKTASNHVETVSGEIFYFAEPHEVKAKMTDLLDWLALQEMEQSKNPIILAAEFHYKFILIHPFDDGNGRIARILMNFILMKHGYHPAITKTENKKTYYEVLRISDSGNIEPFIEFIAESVNDSLSLMLNGIKGLPFECDDDIDKQFWLLDQKIKSLGDAITEFKNETNIKIIFNEFIIPLFEQIINQNKKINYYNFSESGIILPNLNEMINDTEKVKMILKSMSTDTIHHLTQTRLYFSFREFNRLNAPTFDYNDEVIFNFNKMEFEVRTKSLKIKYLYSDVIFKNDFNKIIKDISIRHLQFIEKSINTKNN